MSIRYILVFALTTAILIAVVLAQYQPHDQSAVQAELQTLVQRYDDAIYLDLDYEAAKQTAKEIVSLSERSTVPNSVKVRGLIRLVYLEIGFGKWGDRWGKKIEVCESLVSQEPTIDRAEFLLYLGSIRGKWQSKFDEGLEKIQEAIWIANHIEDDRTLALAYTSLSEQHAFLEQSNLVAQNAYRGVAVAKSHGQKSVEVKTLRNSFMHLMHLDKIPRSD